MRYLTKSRFALALQCPTKLTYADDQRYPNEKDRNEFLLALADGGHQVGALAKCLFPEGVEVSSKTHDAQVEETTAALLNERATLFEAAIRVGRLFIRADVLRRNGSLIEIFEVKSKGFDPNNPEIVGAKGGFLAGMKPYLYDVAFQRHVVQKAFPSMQVRAHLILPDKTSRSPEPRVSQRLAIKRRDGRVHVDIDPSLRDGKIAAELLRIVPVNEYLDRLEREPLTLGGWTFSFVEGINELERRLDFEPFAPRLGNHCKACEFRASGEDALRGLRDGRLECLRSATQVGSQTTAQGTILDLYHSRAIEKLFANGKFLLTDLEPEDINLDEKSDQISASHRQWLQSEEARGALSRPFLRVQTLRKELDSLGYPLHFIDFETSRSALPFHKGATPYGQLLFQFSHHQIDQGGRLSHRSQFLAELEDHLPSVSTVRALRKSLAGDQGTVLHWWDHERTVLAEVRQQVEQSSYADVPDRDSLIEFIDNLLGTKRAGGRLFDLGRMIHRTVFFPKTRGSSSLKRVLPALLSQSSELRERYGSPIYGTEAMPSLNFSNQIWVRLDASGSVCDPYSLLGVRVDDGDLEELERLEDDDSVIANGGAAMVAYSVMQNNLAPADDAQRIRTQLLRYCELDTLAMVMAWEAINELVREAEIAS